MGFDSDRVRLGTNAALLHDATVFHDYRIEFTPGASTFDFYSDNVLFGTGNTLSSTVNQIAFGDGTGSANARAELTSYTFSQVPEPSAAALSMIGVLVAVARRRRVRSI